MIQRIQSVYLFLTTILSGLFLTGNLFETVNEETSDLAMNFRGIYETAGAYGIALAERILPFSLLSLLIPLISLIAIFLYRNRGLQLKVTLTLIILEIFLIGAVAYYIVYTIHRSVASLIPGFRLLIPFVTLILSLLAYRGIKKDKKLVRSYERLR